MEELLKKIGIEDKGVYTKNGIYKIDFPDYDDYAKYYSLLENAVKKGIIEEVQEVSQITLQTTNVTYRNDEYQLVLQAELDENLQSLVVMKYE